MVYDFDVNVVEDVVSAGFVVSFADDAGVFGFSSWGDVTAHWEPWVAILLPVLNLIAPSHRHIINYPMMFIRKHHTVLQKLERVIVFSVFFSTNFLTFHVFFEIEIVRGRTDSFTEEDLAEVFSWGFFFERVGVGLAEVKGCVFEGKDGVL